VASERADHRDRRSDALANRDALLDAAARLYAQRGLDVPYDEIARTARVGRATLYRHFPNRQDLLTGILERLVDELEEAAASIPPGPDSFFALFEIALRQQRRYLPLIELLPNRSRLPARVKALRGRVERLFAASLAQAQAGGRVRADLSPSDVRRLMAMLTAVLRPETTAAEQRAAYRLARIVLEPEGGEAAPP
jgi:AcrR family transcriptional regulator